MFFNFCPILRWSRPMSQSLSTIDATCMYIMCWTNAHLVVRIVGPGACGEQRLQQRYIVNLVVEDYNATLNRYGLRNGLVFFRKHGSDIFEDHHYLFMPKRNCSKLALQLCFDNGGSSVVISFKLPPRTATTCRPVRRIPRKINASGPSACLCVSMTDYTSTYQVPKLTPRNLAIWKS